MRKVLAVLVVALACAPLPARAEPDGCIAFGTHASPPGPSPWLCDYVASGPGWYFAETTNPFVISVDRAGVPDRIVLAGRGGIGRPKSGKLPTIGGDRVFVSITCWDYSSGTQCGPGISLGGREGLIVAQSYL